MQTYLIQWVSLLALENVFAFFQVSEYHAFLLPELVSSQGSIPWQALAATCGGFAVFIHNHGFTMITQQKRLVGDELLAFIKSNEASMTKTEQCLGAGYVRQDELQLTGQTMAAFTDFYEAIIEARHQARDIEEAERQVECSNWYDKLSEQDQGLYDAIQERYSDFDKLDANQCQEFMDELSDHGITTGDQFRDAHFYTTYSCNAEAEFAQYYAEEIMCCDLNDAGMNSFLVIDWQATWNCNLRHDFFTIEFDSETFFFCNQVWLSL